ncbi:hypothetical protein EV363DRAFT_1418647 [Boletus edulis]|nr:hypothetical protein EV363DRAFT_1418647 [Boletus edulis]
MNVGVMKWKPAMANGGQYYWDKVGRRNWTMLYTGDYEAWVQGSVYRMRCHPAAVLTTDEHCSEQCAALASRARSQATHVRQRTRVVSRAMPPRSTPAFPRASPVFVKYTSSPSPTPKRLAENSLSHRDQADENLPLPLRPHTRRYPLFTVKTARSIQHPYSSTKTREKNSHHTYTCSTSQTTSSVRRSRSISLYHPPTTNGPLVVGHELEFECDKLTLGPSRPNCAYELHLYPVANRRGVILGAARWHPSPVRILN